MRKSKSVKLTTIPVSFKVKEILPKIFHLKFDSSRDLASTMLRFQEHYESPKFRNQVFSLDEFVAWYRTQKGKFSYYNDWSGFNVPSKILKPFYDGKFQELTVREQKILKTFKNHSKFYLIATAKNKNKANNQSVIRHEIAHALFYLNPDYRKAAIKTLKGLNLKPIHKYLKKLGYHPEVFLDECHAYILTDMDNMPAEGIKVEPYRKAHELLVKNFNRYSKI